MKTIRTLLCTLLFSVLLGASALAAGGNGGVPPMNLFGVLLLAVAIGGLALGASIIVRYVEKYREINRDDRSTDRIRKKK